MTPRMKKEISLLSEKEVVELIHTIRGKRVMLDVDLAKIYEVKTEIINRAVKRNYDSFPRDFMFRLDNKEFSDLTCQFGGSSWGGRRHLPYAFTFNGISMLASVLRSKTAIQRTIFIMRTFGRLQEILAETSGLQDKLKLIEHQVSGDKKRLDVAFDAINFLLDNKRKK